MLKERVRAARQHFHAQAMAAGTGLLCVGGKTINKYAALSHSNRSGGVAARNGKMGTLGHVGSLAPTRIRDFATPQLFSYLTYFTQSFLMV
jgi:hypothetical protein